jgi:Zn-dependent M16 (insulinase) family peptidase
MGNALIGVVSAFVTGLLLLLGTRFVARQSREVGEQQVEVEQRKVDQEAFDRFVTRYESDRQRQDEELAETRHELADTRSLFRVALKHINLLRSEMRRSNMTPPTLPQELETVPWGLLGEGDIQP